MKVKLTIALKSKCSECGGDKTEQTEQVMDAVTLNFTRGLYQSDIRFDEQTLWLKIEPIKEAL